MGGAASRKGMLMSLIADSKQGQQDRPRVLVRCPEELDAATVPRFAAELGAVGPDSEVIVELGSVRFCGSRGVAVLLDADRRLRAAGGSLVLGSPSPIVEQLLNLSGLQDHFDVRRPVRSMAPRRYRRGSLAGVRPF
jgi:anti-anti-sigma factor